MGDNLPAGWLADWLAGDSEEPLQRPERAEGRRLAGPGSEPVFVLIQFGVD